MKIYENPKCTHAFILHMFSMIKGSSICLDLASIGSFDEFLEYPFEFWKLKLEILFNSKQLTTWLWFVIIKTQLEEPLG